MLKLERFGEPQHHVRLKLAQERDSVALVAVDENGEPLPRGYIARLLPDGRLVLDSNIDPALGLKLDDKGHIVTLPL